MYSRKNNGVVVCRISRARTPNPRFWYDASCLLTDSVFDCIGKTYRETPTLYFRSIRLPFSLMVAFGTDTEVASMQLFRSTITIFGKQISGNVERDKINVAKLNEMGWRVIEIWQCQLKPKNKELTLSNLITELQNE